MRKARRRRKLGDSGFLNSNSDNQKWIIEPYGNKYRIKNVTTGLDLDDMGSTIDGADL